MTDKENRLTPKQEAFALAYMETGKAVEAYRRAYDVELNAKDNWIYVEASQLLDHPKISARIEELQKEAERLTMFTLRKASEEYEQARKMAMKESNPSAAIAAINGKVRLFGLEQPPAQQVDVNSTVRVQISNTPGPLTTEEFAEKHGAEFHPEGG